MGRLFLSPPATRILIAIMNPDIQKPRVEIEAPTKEQISAAKKMRREQQMAFLHKPSESEKKQRRFGIEGIVLMLSALALLYFLYPLGPIAWILAFLPFLGGVLVLIKGWK